MKIYAIRTIATKLDDLVYQFRRDKLELDDRLIGLLKKRMGEVEFNKILEINNKKKQKGWVREKSIGMGEGEFDNILEREKREKREKWKKWNEEHPINLLPDKKPLTDRDIFNKHCQAKFGQDIIKKVIELFRNSNNEVMISNALQIPLAYISKIIEMNSNG